MGGDGGDGKGGEPEERDGWRAGGHTDGREEEELETLLQLVNCLLCNHELGPQRWRWEGG